RPSMRSENPMPELFHASPRETDAKARKFYSGGIRRSELTQLELHDLNCERQTLQIRHGKGHKDRVVPVGNRVLRGSNATSTKSGRASPWTSTSPRFSSPATARPSTPTSSAAWSAS